MTARRIAAGVVALAAALGLFACFDSLVGDSCTSGFMNRRGTCVPIPVDAGPHDGPVADARPDATPDGTIDATPDAIDAAPDAMADAGVDAQVCTLPTIDCGGICTDITSDANNCGGCGRVCASGVCTASTCAGSLSGHIIAIGHDYRSFHAAMARVLGDSVALGSHINVGVARFTGTAAIASQTGVTQAITQAMLQIDRPWHAVPLPAGPGPGAFAGVDVLVVDAQTGDGDDAEAAGAAWKASVTSFVAGGGVVVVLEGASGVSYRFALGAALFSVGAPVDATGQLATVVDATDATTQLVVSPYLAESTSVTFPGAPPSTIATIAGGTVVFHLTRP
ncbi:MAG TPA: hypothetical protein VIX73_39150 [Kofleriaceae bacterium]